jgi:DAK2 domain fusion protein YloV
VLAAASWLERHADAINALNVFPVPDGDTGLNMSLTLRAAADEIAAESTPASTLGEVAAHAAHGALMGARGNSGVILAQWLRAVARTFDPLDVVTGAELGEALSAAADAAYAAVSVPVEGTILTVAREAAEAARDAALRTQDVVLVLESASRQARSAVARTPELLPILKQAGVVDSGGEGLRIVIEGLLMALRGDTMAAGAAPIAMRADLSSLHQEGDDFYGYCTEVLFEGREIDVAAVRARVEAMGTCALVVGDAELVKVHVHTPQPGAVLDLATGLGELVRVKVDNMQRQHQQFRAGPTSNAAASTTRPGTALVAVALGDGFQEIFRSLGATVVPGGQTMNPSVQEIARAIADAGADEVIVLPNDKNVVLAANQALELAPGPVVVVIPTRNVAQGIAAALALNPEEGVDRNVPALRSAADRCRCIEITTAVRDARLDSVDVHAGDMLAILDDSPVAAALTAEDAVAAALSRLPAANYELATVYIGAEGSTDGASRIAQLIGRQLSIEVETAVCGQPYYAYTISVE